MTIVKMTVMMIVMGDSEDDGDDDSEDGDWMTTSKRRLSSSVVIKHTTPYRGYLLLQPHTECILGLGWADYLYRVRTRFIACCML